MRQKTIQAILAHAAKEYPRECCGVIAQKSRVERYFPCRNLAAEPTEQFHLAPEDYAAAEDWGTITGIVHSHPDATTQPSELDKAQCDATLLPWHIVSWPEGDFRTITPRGELPLLGRPFVLGHYDCWGLVMSYFRQEHDVELKDYRVDYPWWEDSYPDNFYQDYWYECGFREFIGSPMPGDLIICRRPTVNRFINKAPPGGFFYGRNMAIAIAIKSRKGGSSSSRTPSEQPDDLQSVAKAKILLALGEGEFAGSLTARDIYPDGTALENEDGSQNFSGVAWEFRSVTQAQKYIQGIPGTGNEINVGSEISSTTAWTRTFTNTQLSAVRLRLKWPSLFKQEDDGDLVGYSVNYAIDLQIDVGTWQTVLNTSVIGKTTSGYERSQRNDLPQAGST